MKSIKLWALAILIGLAAQGYGAGINYHVSSQRFLDKDKKTVVHIDYQIPYNNLVFLAQNGGYFAEVAMNIEVSNQDSLLFRQEIKDNIGISNKVDVFSRKTYLNRISYYLDDEPYQFRITATDLNSQNSSQRVFTASRLNPATLLSDLELCSVVRADSTSYLEKFHRGNTLYQTQPSLIFDKAYSDYVALFFEVYSTPGQRENSGLLLLTVEKDSLIVFDQILDFQPKRDHEGLTLKIPIAELEAGKYVGYLDYQTGDGGEQREFVFFVTEPLQEQYFVFPNSDDDFRLLRYYMGNSLTADWKNYDQETKRRYISQAWKSVAQSSSLGIMAMLDLVRERVDFVNRNFGHFEPGWTTDMGRIYIRNGPPDELDKDTTSDETRYVRKDYQIWKYRSGKKAVYLFVDIQMSGNYKLMYVENDDDESSNPDYLRYLGDDFDTSLLDN